MLKKEIVSVLASQLDWKPASTKIRAGEILLSKKYEFHIEYVLFNHRIHTEEFLFDPNIIVLVSYEQIINILQKYYKENGIQYNLFAIMNAFKTDLKINSLDVSLEENLNIAIAEFNDMFRNRIFEFFASVNTLENCNDYIKGTQIAELYKILHPPGRIHALLIKYLSKEPNWHPFALEVLEIYKRESTGISKNNYLPFYKLLPSLIAELEANSTIAST